MFDNISEAHLDSPCVPGYRDPLLINSKCIINGETLLWMQPRKLKDGVLWRQWRCETTQHVLALSQTQNNCLLNNTYYNHQGLADYQMLNYICTNNRLFSQRGPVVFIDITSKIPIFLLSVLLLDFSFHIGPQTLAQIITKCQQCGKCCRS